MKGDPEVIKVLNEILTAELTAINQYFIHARMCANWGYAKLHAADEKRAIDEMKHAEKLIGRLLFLEGQPVVSTLNSLHIGENVEAQHFWRTVIDRYTDGHCREVNVNNQRWHGPVQIFSTA